MSKKFLPVFFKILTLKWSPFRLSWKNDQLYIDDSSMALFEDELTSYPASSPEGKGFLGKMLLMMGAFLMVFTIILTVASYCLSPNISGGIAWLISGIAFTLLGLIIFLIGLKLKIQSKRYFLSLAEKTMPINKDLHFPKGDAVDIAIKNVMNNHSALSVNSGASSTENNNIALPDNNYDDDENDSSEMKQRES
jgi:hypothetical protein